MLAIRYVLLPNSGGGGGGGGGDKEQYPILFWLVIKSNDVIIEIGVI